MEWIGMCCGSYMCACVHMEGMDCLSIPFQFQLAVAELSEKVFRILNDMWRGVSWDLNIAATMVVGK
jgi:hypothetical protein